MATEKNRNVVFVSSSKWRAHHCLLRSSSMCRPRRVIHLCVYLDRKIAFWKSWRQETAEVLSPFLIFLWLFDIFTSWARSWKRAVWQDEKQERQIYPLCKVHDRFFSSFWWFELVFLVLYQFFHRLCNFH